jgi:cyclophilin family peptidyl-prolyl cis-trans isomerase
MFVKKLLIALMILLGFAGMAEAKKKKPVLGPQVPIIVPTPPATPDNVLVLQLSTGGFVRIQLRPDKAPAHVARYKLLARSGFYDGLLFHRVIDGFMAQTGDPQGTGEGGSPLPDIKAEFNDMPHLRGTLSAARTDKPDTANSQFFIVFSPTLRLDGKYTAFGRVISGMNYVDLIERGEPPAAPSKIVKAWIEADGPNAPRVPLMVPVHATAPAPVAPAAVPVPATTP